MSIPMVEGRRFRLGKYEVVGQPIPHSAHMLRYTVFVDGIRIGALASVPTESDCRPRSSPDAMGAEVFFVEIWELTRKETKEAIRATANEWQSKGFSLVDQTKVRLLTPDQLGVAMVWRK